MTVGSLIEEVRYVRVLSNAPDPRFGGPLKRSLAVARRLRDRNVETLFMVPTGDDGFVDRAGEYGFDCLRINQQRIRSPSRIIDNVRFLLDFYGCYRTVGAIIESKAIDVAHVNGPLNYAVALSAARSSAALAWHFNDTLTPSPLKQISAKLARKYADRRLVSADAVGRYFFGNNSDTTTVYAPVDLNRFNPSTVDENAEAIREELGISLGSRIVGTVGNINPAKGYEYLIESFAAVSDDAHLVIVGRKLASQQAYLDRLHGRIQDLDLEPRVTITGWRDDIPRLLLAFDLFVLASVSEACPMVVLEAMAMKCPVVATDVGGVREQIPVSEYGWVVPPEDPDALAAAVEEAFATESDRSQRAERARSRVEDVFSLERCVETHLEIYRSLLTDRKS